MRKKKNKMLEKIKMHKENRQMEQKRKGATSSLYDGIF